MASKPPPSDAAMQTRIVTHMNADHASSLALFLQHYNNLSSSLAKDPKLTEITLDHLIISSSYGRSFIPLDPPLASYAQARERMILMHQASLKGLGLSDLVVREYRWPDKMWQNLIMASSAWTLMSLNPLAAPYLEKTDSLLYLLWSIGGVAPGLPRLGADVASYVFAFMMLVHGGEAAWLARSRLRKHGVDMGSGLWWKWVCSCFVEGFGAFVRFDELVRGLEEEKAKKKH